MRGWEPPRHNTNAVREQKLVDIVYKNPSRVQTAMAKLTNRNSKFSKNPSSYPPVNGLRPAPHQS
jgi:hypothetical protein